jgi:oligopeptide/dipeptide ABC transporter ATP-binding protein
VAQLADRVAVMYAGHIVEAGPVEAVFSSPMHPYTSALLRAVPRLDVPLDDGPLPVIPGTPPGPLDRPSGCPFRPRCSLAHDSCKESFPGRRESADGLHEVFCHAEVSQP